ncbi:HNH endonuclease [Bdellovibrio sp. HCB274]|uniref:HNH endonuclease n=1 Tax=Bdellovibrio sp. HCB274 TaxID=3394361 RepID=UPI0039B659DC
MNLKKLNQTELDQRMKSLAQRERHLLHEVLLTIKEIDARRSFLDMGFGSLFDYLVQCVGYSEGSAQRRIDAARLIREIPEVAAKIQSGEIKLNQISLVQKASREVYKAQSLKVTSQQKLEVINSLHNKNHSLSQQQVAAFFDLPVLQTPHQTVQADESVRIELTLSKELHAKIQHAQELLSHAVPTRDLALFLEYLADKVIKQKTILSLEANRSEPKINMKLEGRGETGESSKVSVAEVSAGTATVAVGNLPRRPSLKIAKQIRGREKCCQYVDPTTGSRCRSTWKLQVDHKRSFWAGGNHQPENLQMLCAGHNKIKYRNEARVRYLS